MPHQESGPTLAELMAPLTIEEFGSQSFHRRAAYMPGDPARVAGLFTVDDLGRAIDGDMRPDGVRQPCPVKAVRTGPSGVVREASLSSVSQLMSLFDSGMTICAWGVEHASPRVTALLTSARRELQFDGRSLVNCYYSPDGQGLGWHFDDSHVVIVQLEGEKQWEFTTEPGATSPPIYSQLARVAVPEARADLSALGMTLRLPDEMVQGGAKLRPGDLLYLPPGTWHRASAEGHSFALTLTFYPLTTLHLLTEFLAFLNLQDPTWRLDLNSLGGTLSGAERGAAVDEFVAARLEELRSQLASAGPEEVSRVQQMQHMAPGLQRMLRAMIRH